MYAIVDIETTGGHPQAHRITEIAIQLFDGKKVVDTYHSLVNPGIPIPAHITLLTGITDEMVADAPSFEDISSDVKICLENAIFVAHNVGFDYSFLREEFKRIEIPFSKKKLCTVRLSRKIIPGLPSYSLGNLCGSVGIKIKNRHRAAGDAEATVKLFKLLLEKDNNNIIEDTLNKRNRESIIPPHLPTKVFENLPEETGVYYFHDKKGKIVYVGKAKNIKSRISGHFSSKNFQKLQLKNDLYDISFEVTGSELVAFLLESEEIKRLWPIYNRAQKGGANRFGIYSYINNKGVIQLTYASAKTKAVPLLKIKSIQEARLILGQLKEDFNLCGRFTSLQPSNHHCFDHQIKKCQGVCANKEDVDEYNLRVKKAIMSLEKMDNSFLLIDKGRAVNERSLILVEEGTYKGFGYVTPDDNTQSLESIKNYIKPAKDNNDVQRIIRSFIEKQHYERLVELN